MRNFALILLLPLLFSCQKDSSNNNTQPPPPSLYFPPLNGTEWQTTTVASLGWNETQLNDLYTYLQQKNTKAFIILKNG